MSADENRAELVEVLWSKDGVDIVQWQKETNKAQELNDVSVPTGELLSDMSIE